MFEFRMPSLGADMDKGIVAAWHVKAGDAVKKGDVVADIETDKGTIAVEIWQPGQVSEILVNQGKEVSVGTPLARLSSMGEGAESLPDLTLEQARPAPTVKEIPKVQQAPETQIAPEPLGARLRHIRISPLARKVARDLGVDLTKVQGTGTDAAITRSDVEAFAKTKVQQSDVFIAPKVAKDLAMRKAIGLAMARSKREIPHYYLQTNVNMTKALKWLAEQNASRSVSERLLPVVLGLKAVTLAIKKVPELNGHFIDGLFRPSNDVQLGVAISLRNGGLVAPAIKNADQKNLDELMHDLMDLIKRARGGKLLGSEITDQTITVTNLGDTGVDTVFGVIHPPQVAMIGFGRISERPWAENGMIGAVPILTLTLAADHRASDGHRGGVFLSTIDKLLQEPQLL